MLASQYTTCLERLGYAVAWCENAQDGIAVADKINPDLVIVELLLAGHSGMEFLYEFRSYSEWRRVPIVVLSRIQRGELPVDDRVLGDLGVNLFLYKPETSLKKLADRLAVLLPPVAKNSTFA